MTDVGSDGAIEVTCRLIYLTVIITTYTGTENIWSTVLGSYGEKSIWQKWSCATPAGKWNFIMWE